MAFSVEMARTWPRLSQRLALMAISNCTRPIWDNHYTCLVVIHSSISLSVGLRYLRIAMPKHRLLGYSINYECKTQLSTYRVTQYAVHDAQ